VRGKGGYYAQESFAPEEVMSKVLVRLFACVFIAAFSCQFLSSNFVFAQAAPEAQSTLRPLRASEVMALQAGGALPANIVHHIVTRGINFHPEEQYLAQLKRAGADASVLAAVKTAKVSASGDVQPDKELLQQISEAAVLIHDKKYFEAITQLSSALKSSFAGPETGFVMGEVLRQKEEYAAAAQVYAEVLREDASFPEAHTKASYILYRLSDSDDALSEAKLELATNPNNAEAHKNAGLALQEGQKADAAIAEYREALRIKPDYASVHYDLGLLLYDQRNYNEAIVEYKKAIALDPKMADAHYNLGLVYANSGNIGAEIAEYREAKRLNPNVPAFRQNLASALMEQDVPAAIKELRELEQKFPNFEMCHVCLGNGLAAENDFDGAEAEYRIAIKLAPEDADAHVGLANLQKLRKNNDAALQEYRAAEQADPGSPAGYENVGRSLLEKKDYAGAVAELKQAVALGPSEWEAHELYAQALAGTGQTELAISELKDAIALDPKQGQVMTELGALLEKKGDWVGALEQYRKGALIDSARVNKGVVGEFVMIHAKDPQKEYAAAQKRFEGHMGALRASGKGDEAAELENRVQMLQASGSTLEKEKAAMQAGDQAMRNGDGVGAEKSFHEAVELAEKLPPGDDKLAVALGKLGQAYAMRQDMTNAEAMFHRQLTVIEKTFGPMSSRMTDPLYFLGMVAAQNKDFASAESYVTRSVDINVQAFGEKSSRAAESFRGLAGLYMAESKWDKAETYLLRSVKALEADGTNPDDAMLLMPLWGLCDLYERSGRSDKAEPCWDRASDVMNKQFGKDTPKLASSLAAEADELRQMGKVKEAAMVQARVAKLQQAVQH
jgi:tetratricopeptide (TPR) repeat protein